ncbi:unnamed protein product [Spirodela intermedia]|uniref:Uncharacterized protein n=1 Tax=Spirodela intermedia TaxID=51605 RepID=A0A7I8K2W8_SPIIN|nr:unnamed protein product [Spirodela intermedia]
MNGGSTPAGRAVAVHFVCVVALAAGGWISRHVCSSGLVSEPARVLRLLVVIESPVVIIAYSLVRSDKERTSFLKAVGRGFLGLPLGALLNAFGAIVLGAPFWIEYLKRTINWSLLMSLFTFVPAVCVFGYSRKDWLRILALAKMARVVDYMVSLPAHGAVIGAWFGAWPMPLDWERPWQEWPICVTYGAVLGYVVGVLASLSFILCQKVHKKED